jgi:hypothetical protein
VNGWLVQAKLTPRPVADCDIPVGLEGSHLLGAASMASPRRELAKLRDRLWTTDQQYRRGLRANEQKGTAECEGLVRSHHQVREELQDLRLAHLQRLPLAVDEEEIPSGACDMREGSG